MDTSDRTALGESSTGLRASTAAALGYLFGWVSALVLLLVERRSDFVRFHALQSLIVSGALTLASMAAAALTPSGWRLGWTFGLVGLALTVLMMVKALRGERYKLPLIGALAEDLHNGPNPVGA